VRKRQGWGEFVRERDCEGGDVAKTIPIELLGVWTGRLSYSINKRSQVSGTRSGWWNQGEKAILAGGKKGWTCQGMQGTSGSKEGTERTRERQGGVRVREQVTRNKKGESRKGVDELLGRKISKNNLNNS